MRLIATIDRQKNGVVALLVFDESSDALAAAVVEDIRLTSPSAQVEIDRAPDKLYALVTDETLLWDVIVDAFTDTKESDNLIDGIEIKFDMNDDSLVAEVTFPFSGDKFIDHITNKPLLTPA